MRIVIGFLLLVGGLSSSVDAEPDRRRVLVGLSIASDHSRHLGSSDVSLSGRGAGLVLLLGWRLDARTALVLETSLVVSEPRYVRDGRERELSGSLALVHGYLGVGAELAFARRWWARASVGPATMLLLSPQVLGWSDAGFATRATVGRVLHVSRFVALAASSYLLVSVLPDHGTRWAGGQIGAALELSLR